ncbi:MAG TPA: thioredoxin fold domain-containing protein [Syntrophorhabdaceae bacterium]|nr:thioredoxin fold domain-containing protein [Syntrophorhabdaceae bacterium]MDI9560944.1 thioredoxin fold domain-containing protein [Pseudomonadota bacterium]MBP8697782.1 thioredoxin fold domain-containing protein [Syntrophorhabdaceae bacterium]HPN97199.1 thioredoxin fold domain-containing protein [Syntrophorhabdaceae bacterium]HQI55783.1 thioredoxin fold domain-containing protein [Syntrophorhabdaceae bacterium]
MNSFDLILSSIVKLIKIKIAFVIFILLFACTQTISNEYKDELKRAEREDKPVILYFYSNYCRFCDLMDRDVLNDNEINPILKKDIVYIRVNVNKKTELPRLYGIRGYPTTSLLDPSGKLIVQIPGYINKNVFKMILQFLKDKHYKTMTLNDFVSR